MNQTFDQYLEARDIDCQRLTPEMKQALQSQFEQETAPPAEQVVLTDDECWPLAVRQAP